MAKRKIADITLEDSKVKKLQFKKRKTESKNFQTVNKETSSGFQSNVNKENISHSIKLKDDVKPELEPSTTQDETPYQKICKQVAALKKEKKELAELNAKDFSTQKRIMQCDGAIGRLESAKSNMPSIRPSQDGLLTMLQTHDETRKILSFADANHMIHYFLINCPNFTNMKWFKLMRPASVTQMVLVVVEGVSIDAFKDLNVEKKKICKYYNKMIEAGTLVSYKGQYCNATQEEQLSPLWKSVRMFLPRTCSLMNFAVETSTPSSFGQTMQETLFYRPSSGEKKNKEKFSVRSTQRDEYQMFKKYPEPALPNVIMPVYKSKNSTDGKDKASLPLNTFDYAHKRLKLNLERNGEESISETLVEKGVDDLLKVFGGAANVRKNIDGIFWTKVKRKYLQADKFDRCSLLMPVHELKKNNYPLPKSQLLVEQTETQNWIQTKETYARVSANSPMFGLDCEFYGNTKKLRMIAIVNEAGQKVLFQILPHKESNHAQVQDSIVTKIRKFLPPDAILVGHQLNSDLTAMKMCHPYNIDTTILFHIVGSEINSLKYLSSRLLHREIQIGSHDPVEDALASLDLVKLKLSKYYTFGNAYIDSEERLKGEMARRRIGIDFINSLQIVRNRNPESVSDKYSILAAKSLLPDWKKEMTIVGANNELPVLEDNDQVIERAIVDSRNNTLTVVHLEADPRYVSEKRKPRLSALSNVDQQVERLYKSLPLYTWFTVMFTPNEEGQPTSPGDPRKNGFLITGLTGKEKILNE